MRRFFAYATFAALGIAFLGAAAPLAAQPT